MKKKLVFFVIFILFVYSSLSRADVAQTKQDWHIFTHSSPGEGGGSSGLIDPSLQSKALAGFTFDIYNGERVRPPTMLASNHSSVPGLRKIASLDKDLWFITDSNL